MNRFVASTKIFAVFFLGGILISLTLEIFLFFFKIPFIGKIGFFISSVTNFGLVGLIYALIFYLKYRK